MSAGKSFKRVGAGSLFVGPYGSLSEYVIEWAGLSLSERRVNRAHDRCFFASVPLSIVPDSKEGSGDHYYTLRFGGTFSQSQQLAARAVIDGVGASGVVVSTPSCSVPPSLGQRHD